MLVTTTIFQLFSRPITHLMEKTSSIIKPLVSVSWYQYPWLFPARWLFVELYAYDGYDYSSSFLSEHYLLFFSLNILLSLPSLLWCLLLLELVLP
ncbi:hypothetical protein Patl1_18830 [Pistacia atlantica]|uniref:Uncharacterized protein n=1 Tax=Pistacia atlantica TaxID=434234 RepID=A0ACC1C101_9ROSI|nr:hypothetical protein Patl1_18830 [Pistacia atlantica]